MSTPSGTSKATVAGKAAASRASSAPSKEQWVKGGMLAAGMFTARRAAWPTLVASTVVTSALWFGIFEITLSLSKFVLPAPKESSSRQVALPFDTLLGS